MVENHEQYHQFTFDDGVSPISAKSFRAGRFANCGIITFLPYTGLDTALQNLEDEIKRDGLSDETLEKYRKVVRNRWIRAVIIHIGLLSALIAYSFIGAAIFQALEEEHAADTRIDLVTAKEELINQLWLESQNQTESVKLNWTEKISMLLSDYDKKLVEAAAVGIDVTNITQHRQNVSTQAQDWNFWNSLLFAGTVYTTIGYGHLSPATTEGRIAAMIYALIGIPLCVIVLADLGGLLGELIKFIMRQFKKCCFKCCRRSSKHRSRAEIEHLSGFSIFIVLVCICVVYLFAGAYMYTIWETQWSYLDSFWFIFISFSTIGFGDLVPNHPKYFLLTFSYIFFGLALISTGFTVLQQVLQSTINKATDQLDARLGIEEGSSSSLADGGNPQDRVTLVHMKQKKSNNRISVGKEELALSPVDM